MTDYLFVVRFRIKFDTQQNITTKLLTKRSEK